MHGNICGRIGSSNQDGLDSSAAALSQRGERGGGGGRIGGRVGNEKEWRMAGRRKLKQTAFQYEVLSDHHRVHEVFHRRE